MNTSNEKDWDLIIQPSTSWFSLDLKGLWQYRDLFVLMVKRDLTTVYKQTVLGPVWFFLQPIITTFIFTLIFGKIAHLSTDGMPPVLFYLSGLILWNYFSETVLNTSKTFVENAPIFGKVYFPRLIMPLAKTVSGMIKFIIQFVLFIAVLLFYKIQGVAIAWHTSLIFIPYLLILMAGLGLGLGILLSSLTTKYRDLIFLINFGIQLAMYATPVILPFSSIPLKYQWVMWLNPMTSVIETFRYACMGTSAFDISGLLYSTLCMLLLLLVGVVVFNKVEKSFIDTV
jgi:lipopolysaccharide transport system permease protein